MNKAIYQRVSAFMLAFLMTFVMPLQYLELPVIAEGGNGDVLGNVYGDDLYHVVGYDKSNIITNMTTGDVIHSHAYCLDAQAYVPSEKFSYQRYKLSEVISYTKYPAGGKEVTREYTDLIKRRIVNMIVDGELSGEDGGGLLDQYIDDFIEKSIDYEYDDEKGEFIKISDMLKYALKNYDHMVGRGYYDGDGKYQKKTWSNWKTTYEEDGLDPDVWVDVVSHYLKQDLKNAVTKQVALWLITGMPEANSDFMDYSYIATEYNKYESKLFNLSKNDEYSLWNIVYKPMIDYIDNELPNYYALGWDAWVYHTSAGKSIQDVVCGTFVKYIEVSKLDVTNSKNPTELPGVTFRLEAKTKGVKLNNVVFAGGVTKHKTTTPAGTTLEFTTGSTPTRIYKIPAGDYTLSEYQGIGGYTHAENVNFTVNEDGTVVLKDGTKVEDKKLVVENKKTDITIYKVDAETGEKIGDAKIEIEDASGKMLNDISDTLTINGIRLIGELSPGTYILYEREAPKGYVNAFEDGFEFTVNNDGSIYYEDEDGCEHTIEDGILNIPNEELVTTIQISKIEIGGSEELEGATLTVYDSEGNIAKDKDGKELTWTSGTSAKTIEGLKLDTEYTLKETGAPSGYAYAEEVKFKLKEEVKDGKHFAQVYVYNNETKAYEKADKVTLEDGLTSVTFSKTDATGEKELGGAKLEILDKDGNVVKDKDGNELKWTSEEGKSHEIKGVLNAGETYTMRETIAPDGYLKSTDVKFTLNKDGKVVDDNGNETTVVMKDEITEITVSKTSVGKSEELKGATLTVYDSDGTVAKDINGNELTWTSGDSAKTINGLTVDEEYTLKEEGAPSGYAYSEDVKFKLADEVENGKHITQVYVYNNETKAYEKAEKVTMEDGLTRVVISKTDITGSTELEGAKLQVLDKDGNVKDEWISGSDAHSIVGVLNAGETYILHEENAPEGYTYAEDIEFTVNKYNEVTEVTMQDGDTVVVISKQAVGGSEELAGAKLVLKDSEGAIVAEWTSGETSKVITNLYADATYTLIETGAPDGYAYAESITFEVNKGGTVLVNGEVVDEVIMRDDVTKVTVSKTDITGKTELKGAKLQVIDKNGKVVEEWTSNGKSHTITGKLIAGQTYTLHEEGAPNGYAYAEDVKFTVDKNGNTTKVVMKDKVTKVTISKTDASNGKKITGAVLQILDSNGKVVEQWTSSSDETHKVYGKLIAGETYTLHEVSAPEGYEVAADITFTVNADGSETKVVMKDNSISVKGGGGDDESSKTEDSEGGDDSDSSSRGDSSSGGDSSTGEDSVSETDENGGLTSSDNPGTGMAVAGGSFLLALGAAMFIARKKNKQ